MGITASDIELITMAIHQKPGIKNVCELGSQNLYRAQDDREKPPFASELYKELGISYGCIDMAGDNNASTMDLSKDQIGELKRFDLVTDFGTSEHVVADAEMYSVPFHDGHINSMYPKAEPLHEDIRHGYYNCWKNKHNLLSVGGIMINVNPKTENWPGHGYTYIDKVFYLRLAELMGYEIYWLNENPAMGNDNALNIECVFRKAVDVEFVSFEDFQTCNQYPS